MIVSFADQDTADLFSGKRVRRFANFQLVAEQRGLPLKPRSMVMSIAAGRNGLRAVHPGEILREEYLMPMGMSANALAQALKVPASRVNDIVLERRGITVDTALRLVRFFGGDVQSWMNLQTAYEIKSAERDLAKRIEKEVRPLAA